MSFVIGLRNSGMFALPRDSNQYRLSPSPDEACRCEPNCRYRSGLLGPIPFIPQLPPQLFAKAGQIHTTDDVVLYPVRVPPLFGVDLDSIELHGEVDVVSSGHPCHAAQSHNLRAFDRVALVYIDPTHVAVDCLQAISMVHNNAVAIDPEGSSPSDTAVIRGLDADMLGDGEIVTEVHLLVDLVAMVDIAAHVSKGGLGLGVRLACERLMPEKPIGCLQSQAGQSLVVGLA